jgi:hypothetical protein
MKEIYQQVWVWVKRRKGTSIVIVEMAKKKTQKKNF